MKIPIASGSTYDNAFVAHDSFMSNDLSRNGLHKHDRVCTHSISIMEKLWHTKYHDVIFLLSEWDIGTFISHFPRFWLHFFCISTENFYLSGFSIEHSITTKEFFTHFFFHMQANFIKLITH